MDFTYNLKEQLKVTINPETTKDRETQERAKTETTLEAQAKTIKDTEDNYYT